jgi:membrane-bound serine protease (ClpP class)
VSSLLLGLLLAAGGGVDVVEINGPLDPKAAEFVIEAIEEAAADGRQAVIIQLDSTAAVGPSDALFDAADKVGAPPLPVVVWVGPAPAVARGGAVNLLRLADIAAAAPGARLGYSQPWLAAGPVFADTADYAQREVVVEVGSPYVDIVQPALRQLLAALDGRLTDSGFLLDTIDDDGTPVEVRFRQPGLWSRFLRLGVRPEAAFFFLVSGLTVAVLEFYAVGPGLAAGVAALSLFLAGYGIAVLPVRWWAVLLTLLGMGWLVVSYQRGTRTLLTSIGVASIALGGVFFVRGAPQLVMPWWGVAGAVVAVLFFFLLAMPAVTRSRFSTGTIGRGHLIGKTGSAEVDFAPDGVVEVDGARWVASAHRESGIRRGDSVRVMAVAGWTLAVEPEREKSG